MNINDIEVGKFYRTSGGHKAEVLKIVNNKDQQNIFGVVFTDGKYYSALWDERCLSYFTSYSIISEWVERPIVDWSLYSVWYKYIAMDKDGKWYVYKEKPTIEYQSYWASNDSSSFIPNKYIPKFEGDWKDSLVVRPE